MFLIFLCHKIIMISCIPIDRVSHFLYIMINVSVNYHFLHLIHPHIYFKKHYTYQVLIEKYTYNQTKITHVSNKYLVRNDCLYISKTI